MGMDRPRTPDSDLHILSLQQPRALPENTPSSIHFDQTIEAASPDALAELLVYGHPEEPSSFSGELSSSFVSLEAMERRQTIPENLRYFGEYELLEEVARGGMGVVYKAVQRRLNRIVAIKMILGGCHADVADVATLQAEAQIVAKLNHPNIVTVYEVGEIEGRHYFSMDYVNGRSLAQVAGRQPLHPKFAVKCVETIARAIHYSHTQGVLHRDLKPSNVLVEEESYELRITDFGAAKWISSDASRTFTNRIMGTPSYMPPEQAAGRSDLLGPHSDVYSLGAILYELITGRPPFQAPNPIDILKQVHDSEPVRPSLLNPRIPRDLETICLKCLRKAPSQRYASAEALADDLERLRCGEPIAARPPRTHERLMRWSRRQPRAAFGIVLIATMLLGVVFSSLWYNAMLSDSHEQLEEALLHAQEREAFAAAQTERLRESTEYSARQRELAEQRELSARQHSYAVTMNQIEEAWQMSDLDRVIDLLNLHRPESGQLDLRGFEWHYYWQLCHSELQSFADHESVLTCVAYSPDNRRVATGGTDGRLRLWDVKTGKQVQEFWLSTSATTSLTFSPDGQLLVGGNADGALKVWRIETGEELDNFRAHSDAILALAYSPDSNMLATGGRDHRVRLWNARTLEWVGDCQGHAGPLRSLAFSPDGQMLATAGSDAEIKLWDVAKRHPLGALQGHEDHVNCIAFTHEGERLLSACEDGTIRLWDPQEQSLKNTIKVGRGPITSFALSPYDHTLAVGTAERLLILIDMRSWREITTLRAHAEAICQVAYAPDGRSITSCSTDGTAKLWSPHTQQNSLMLEHSKAPVSAVAYSPDGQWLAVGTGPLPRSQGKHIVLIRNTQTWEVQHELVVPLGKVTSLDFSPDGKLLAASSRGSTSHSGRVTLWETKTGEVWGPLEKADAPVNRVCFCPGNKWLFAVGVTGKIRRWDLRTKQPLPAWEGHNAEVTNLALCAQSRHLVTSARDGTLRLWNMQQQSPTNRTLLGEFRSYNPVAFSPKGKLLATTRPSRHFLPQGLGTKECLELLQELNYCSRDALPLGQVCLLDTETEHEKFVLKGHRQQVRCLVFSSDGRRLATGSDDATIKLWDTQTGHELATFRGHQGVISDLCFSPAGQVLVSASSDGTVRIWSAEQTHALAYQNLQFE